MATRREGGMGRRSFLGLGVAAAAALSGCSAGSGRSGPVASSPTAAIPPSSAHGGPGRGPDWAGLRAGLTGHLTLPTDSSYLRDLQLFDSRYDSRRPAAIAYCATPGDVQRSLSFARTNSLPLAARSGGHSYAGYSTSTGLVIDVTAMNQVSLNGATATIGAGARLIDVYTALNGRGVSIPAGSCPTVGIAGLTLGGGVGVVDRLYGLTCDSLTAVQVVTADGRLVSADRSSASDLFWACQGGGGGNFGIVTSLTFRTFPTSGLAVFSLEWPWSAASQVLPAWLGWAPAAPDPLWSNCVIETRRGAAQPSLRVSGVWAGTVGDAAAQLVGLEAAVGGAPAGRTLNASDFGHSMYLEAGCASLSQSACHLPGQTPGGTLPRSPSLARSDFLDSPLSSAGVAAVTAGIDAQQAAGRPGAVGFDAFGGAVNRVAADATAFVHRNALCSAQWSVPFSVDDPPSVLAAGQTWLDGWYASLRPFVSGYAYQNYIDPALADWGHAYYGTNLARLSRIKRVWDPDDVFRFAQSIPVGS